MPKAVWNNTVLAESQEGVVVEGNYYFPTESIQCQYFQPSATKTICPWKGEAHYYNIVIDGKTNPDAAWYYPDPSPEARDITDHIAFWKGVEVIP